MTDMKRPDGRATDALRPISFECGYINNRPASVLVCYGNTKVICNAILEEKVPYFLKGKNQGWLTAEYGMLPSATNTRTKREGAVGNQTGRTREIQRLIGRSLRACLDLRALGENTIIIDCDVIQADGGTRTASISGAYIALSNLISEKLGKSIASNPLYGMIAAVSCGIYKGVPVLDLNYAEDSSAETDMNIVMNDSGAYIEIQGTAEGHAFRPDELQALLKLAHGGINEIIAKQRSVLKQ